jgi:hypothetical protein
MRVVRNIKFYRLLTGLTGISSVEIRFFGFGKVRMGSVPVWVVERGPAGFIPIPNRDPLPQAREGKSVGAFA